MIPLPARVLNLAETVTSYLLSRIVRRPVHWGDPVAVSIEPANLCNLHCPECPSGTGELTRARGVMQPGLFRKVIGQLAPSLSYLTLYFQGEPYLSSHFFEMAAIARSHRIFTATSTNGHFLDEESVHRTLESGLNRLIVSLDGFDSESYAAYRKGGDFEKVINGIRLLVNEKRRLKKRNPEIVLQCLILRTNEKRLDEIRQLGRSLGVDRVEFKTAQFNDYRNGNPLMPENPKFSRYREKVSGFQGFNVSESQGFRVSGFHRFRVSGFQGFRVSNFRYLATSPPRYFVLKNPMRNSCFRMWTSCVITWDGKVVPCCYDKDANHVMGNLNEQTFREIWRGEKYRRFREKILSNRKSVEICTNCGQRR